MAEKEDNVDTSRVDRTPNDSTDYVPGEDPSIENSMSVLTCCTIIGLCMLFTDFFWGSHNRHCMMKHTKLGLDAWTKQLEASNYVQDSCSNYISGMFYPGSMVHTTLHGSCTYLHPTTESSYFLHQSSVGNSEIAGECMGRWAAWMALAVFIGTFIVTMTNPHTRGMLPWIIRNPMGLEVN